MQAEPQESLALNGIKHVKESTYCGFAISTYDELSSFKNELKCIKQGNVFSLWLIKFTEWLVFLFYLLLFEQLLSTASINQPTAVHVDFSSLTCVHNRLR